MYPVVLPRHACSPRDKARAADLWRLVQEVTILDSTARGWPPARYREIGTGFVVRELLGIHLKEAHYGEPLVGYSRVVESRRELLMRREAGLEGVLVGSAEWVHIGAEGGPSRAPKPLVDAFPVTEPSTPVHFPDYDEIEPRSLGAIDVRPWWTEMDPMGHVNHPRYVDWAEEVVAVWLAERGVDPLGVVPKAERVRFRAAAVAGDVVHVAATLIGRAGGAAVIHVKMRRGEITVCDAWLVRDHLAGAAVWG